MMRKRYMISVLGIPSGVTSAGKFIHLHDLDDATPFQYMASNPGLPAYNVSVGVDLFP